MKAPRIVTLAVAFLCLAWIAPSLAATGYTITGFRSAKFGMTEAEVRAAIAKDFNVQGAAIVTAANPVDRTTGLVIRLPQLEPGPGPAAVSYLLGASSKRLMHVNVVWAGAAKPDEKQRQAFATAGLQLSTYFRQQDWGTGKTVAGVPQAGDEVILFAGVDVKGGAVQVNVTGVPFQRSAGDKTTDVASSGVPQLSVSYSADAAHPDVYKVKSGAF